MQLLSRLLNLFWGSVTIELKLYTLCISELLNYFKKIWISTFAFFWDYDRFQCQAVVITRSSPCIQCQVICFVDQGEEFNKEPISVRLSVRLRPGGVNDRRINWTVVIQSRRIIVRVYVADIFSRLGWTIFFNVLTTHPIVVVYIGTGEVARSVCDAVPHSIAVNNTPCFPFFQMLWKMSRQTNSNNLFNIFRIACILQKWIFKLNYHTGSYIKLLLCHELEKSRFFQEPELYQVCDKVKVWYYFWFSASQGLELWYEVIYEVKMGNGTECPLHKYATGYENILKGVTQRNFEK